MKKLLLLFAVTLLLGTASFAQEVPAKREFDYCDVTLITVNGFRISIAVDYGQERKRLDEKVRDAAGKPLIFNSPIAVLHYMTEQGWELVEVYQDKDQINNYKHYLLKRKRSI